MKESDLFRPLDLPTELASLDQEVFYKLQRKVLEFGILREGATVVLMRNKPDELSVSVSSKPQNRSMVVIGAGRITSQGSFLIKFPDTPGFEPSFVVWDRRVTVQQIIGFIDIASEIGRSMREQLGPRGTFKLRVADVFANPGVSIPILPGGPDAETLLAEFDYPEELTVISNELTGVDSICHRRDVPYLEERRRIVLAILQEEGIDVLSAGELGFERILELRKKIDQRMRN